MSEVQSPCVGICSLDINDVCVGCYRSGTEIASWGTYSDDEKRAVIAKCGEREEDSGMVFSR